MLYSERPRKLPDERTWTHYFASHRNGTPLSFQQQCREAERGVWEAGRGAAEGEAPAGVRRRNPLW